MYTSLLVAISQMLQQCLDDNLPEAFISDYESNHRAELIFRRTLELQIEQCEAIHLLCHNGLFRPAHAVLRSILENIATLTWIAIDVDRYSDLFEENKQPNTKEILTRIGWAHEYDRTFRFLSGFVHSDMTHADLYRKYEFGGESSEGQEVIPEITSDGEIYLIQTPDGYVPLSINRMSSEETEKEYMPYIVAKTFDLNIAGIMKLYGTNVETHQWWPKDAIALFIDICKENPDIKKFMLWKFS